MSSHATFVPVQKQPRPLKAMLKRIIWPALGALFRRLHDLTERFVRADLPRFANEPKNLCIELPRRIAGAECMTIGDNVRIGPSSLLVAQTSYPSIEMQHPDDPVPLQRFQPRIVIGHRVTATGGLTLDAMQEIVIEDDVMFGANIIVMDGLHGYARADVPYKYQPMGRIAPVRIGRGAWIAQNVVIMPGVTIGEYAIVGANSVVTHDIPARSIAFGNPARVVKHWVAQTRRWESAERVDT